MVTENELITRENVKAYIVNTHQLVVGKGIALCLFMPIVGVCIDVVVNSSHDNFHFLSPLSLILWIIYIIWGVVIYFKIVNNARLPNDTLSLLMGHCCGVSIIAAISAAINSMVLIGNMVLLLLGILSIVVLAAILIKFGIWATNRQIYKVYSWNMGKKPKKQKMIYVVLAQSFLAFSGALGLIIGRAFISILPTEAINSYSLPLGIAMVWYVLCMLGGAAFYYRVYLIRKFKLSNFYIETKITKRRWNT